MKKVFLLLMTVVVLFSCSLEDDGQNFQIETLPVKEAIVPSSFEHGGVYDITIKYDLPNGCHSFYDFHYQYEGTARIVAVNSFVNTDAPCTEALIEDTRTFKVNVIQREDYVFRFWKGQKENGENIFEEIIVPVTENK